MKVRTWNWNSTRSNLSPAWSWETGSRLGPWRCRESLGSSRTWGILRGNHSYRLTCSPGDSCDLQRCRAYLLSQVKVSLKSRNKKNWTYDRRPVSWSRAAWNTKTGGFIIRCLHEKIQPCGQMVLLKFKLRLHKIRVHRRFFVSCDSC